MRFLFLIFFIAPIAFASTGFAQEVAQPLPSDAVALEVRQQPVPAAPPAADASRAFTLIKEAEQLIDAGEFGEARTRLERALEVSMRLDTFEQVKQAIGKINLSLLFSKRLTSDSELYEVVPGDTLSDIATKRYRTTYQLIMKSNGLRNHIIRPGDQLKVSKATFTITVDKSDRALILLSDGKFFKQYPAAVGKSDSETPTGTFSIENKLENPTWYHAGATVPPDSPENILGTRWMGFSLRGYGIHGTTDPASVGQASTSGCIRLRNEDVEELYTIVPTGAWVTVTE